jgi:glycosyltransferase involved in cell wall biosynthesis
VHGENNIQLSIVIPVFNEESNLEHLYKEICSTLDERPIACEVIFVDDGSTDQSVKIVENLIDTQPAHVLIRLRRNYGQTAAMAAGFEASKGLVVIPLDADGQNDPADIWRLYDLQIQGFDCVSGWRKTRKDKAVSRKLPSVIANRLILWATGIRIHDSGCTIKAYNGELLRSIHLYGEMHRLIPFYIHLAGGTVTELEVNHRAREFGTSKYGISRTFRVIQDVLVAKVQADFARRPMHLFGNIGLISILLGAFAALTSIVLKMAEIRDFIETPLLQIASLLVVMGFQFALTGLLAEIVIRKVNLGADDRPYAIKESKK